MHFSKPESAINVDLSVCLSICTQTSHGIGMSYGTEPVEWLSLFLLLIRGRGGKAKPRLW